ncbi:MAG: MerR family transcriptional regulator [Clostridiales Family XIII bacterium]|jgi:DNA-binding transcriptional MerR regulator|nr:MerR family transcriptional regulator [Clostridiales Family XIII bacterium]
MERDRHLLSIREFSDFTGIKQTTLRYYDDIGLFSPVLHTDSGYRYYSPTQITALNAIQVLIELNVPMRSIIKIQQGRTPEKMLNLCFDTRKQLDTILRRTTRLNNIISAFQNLLFDSMKVGSSDEFGISLDYFPAQAGTLGPVNDFGERDDFFVGFQNFCMSAMELKMDLCFPVAGYFESAEGFFGQPGRPDRFFLMDPMGREEKEAGVYLYSYLRGGYGEVGDLPERMKAYAEENDIELNGPVYHIFLNDEVSVRDSTEYVSLLAITATPRNTSAS